MKGRVLAITGPSGAGKTWLRQILGERLSLPTLDIADFGKIRTGRWYRLIEAVDRIDGQVIVECCVLPIPLQRRLGEVMHLTAPSSLRWQRLIDRGETEARARTLLNVGVEVPRWWGRRAWCVPSDDLDLAWLVDTLAEGWGRTPLVSI